MKGRVDYFDELLSGFGQRVSAKSRKSWFVFYGVKGGVTKIYNRFSYADEKRDALDRWGRRLEAVLGIDRGNVAALATAKR